MSAVVRFFTALICDQVRIEKNNKQIILGIYSGNVHLKSVPSDLRLTAVIIGEASGNGEQTAHIRFSASPKEGDGKTAMMETEVGIVSTENSNGGSEQVLLELPPMPIQVSGPMILSIEWSLDNEHWELLLKKDIEIG